MPAWVTELLQWVDRRLPITNTFERHLSKHPVPAKVNFWYLFGALAMVAFVIQILSGIWLVMSYNPSAEGAFRSVEYIMRDVDLGWLLRYMHSTGASAFFVVVYLHMFRALLYGSYRKPRELVWLLGVGLFIVLMAEGFFGYILPYGQMSHWGAQVIVSLVGAVPVIGEEWATWFRGDYVISGITLARFFALHVVLLPLVLIALVAVHLIGLHEVGAGNPDGVDMEARRDSRGVPIGSVPFFPYKVVQAVFATGLFLLAFCLVLFFAPTFFGYFLEAANFQPANPLVTPEHIVPVWYYMPFYAMLRATTFGFLGLDAKFWGLVVMAMALVVLLAVPWLDRSPAPSLRHRGWPSRVFLAIFVVSFLVLGWLGSVTPSENRELLAQVCTLGYFSYFLLMPVYTSLESYSEPPPLEPVGDQAQYMTDEAGKA